MNIDTGKIYNSKEEALIDGSKEEQLVFGPLKTLKKLKKRLRMVSKFENHRRIAKKKQQKLSCKKNR